MPRRSREAPLRRSLRGVIVVNPASSPHRALTTTARRRSPTLSQRILPLKPGKSRKVTIRRTEQESMFDGNGGQMGIGYKVGSQGDFADQPTQDQRMLRGRLRNPDRREIEPRFDLLPGFADGPWTLKDARIGDQTDKGQKRWPRQSDSVLAVQPAVQPLTRRFMLREGFDMGVDQQVGIDENHL